MEELVYPIYVIEYFYTYCDALWCYENNGVDDSFSTANPGETIAIFRWEEDAREYFKKHKCDRMDFYDPNDYLPDSPDLGVGYYILIKYTDNWNDEGTILEKSRKGISARQLQKLFKESEIDLKKLSRDKNEQTKQKETYCEH